MRIGAAAALLVFLSASACSSHYVRAYAGYTTTSLTGSVALAPSGGTTNLEASKVDLEDELGITEGSGSPYGRVDAGLGSFGLTVSAFRYDNESTGTIQQQFGNITAGTQVASDITLDNFKAALFWHLIKVPLSAGSLRVGPGVGVDYVDFKMDMRTLSGVAATEHVDVKAPIPIACLQGDLQLGRFGVTIEAGGMSADVGDAKGTYWDIEGLVRFEVVKHLQIMGGYRFMSLDARGVADGQDFDADLLLNGWFVGGGVSF